MCCDKDNEIKEMGENHQSEVTQLKSDLELKIRLEREKETSFKEHQVQSIEYQKKLQEQLGEKEKQVDELNAKILAATKNHSKEINTASKKSDHLTAQINDIIKEKEEYCREIKSLNEIIHNQSGSKQELLQLQNKISELETCLQEREDEISQKALQIENILTSTETLTDIKAKLESEKNDLAKRVENLNEEVINTKHEIQSLESEHEIAISNLEERYKNETGSLQEIIKRHEESSNIELERSTQTIVELENKLSAKEKGLLEQGTLLNEEKEFTNVANFDLEKAKTEMQNELDSSKQELYELQLTCKAKDSETEDLKSRLRETLEIVDGMRKDLTSTQEDKTAQLLEFEETLEDLEKQVTDQKERNEKLQEQIARQSREIATSDRENNSSKHTEQLIDDHGNNVKAIIKEYEKKLAENGLQHDDEISRLKEATEHEIKAAVGDCRRQITELKEELYEKTSLYEDLIDRHAADCDCL